MRQLDVFLGDNLVGHVVENRKGGRFEYEQSGNVKFFAHFES